MGSMGKDTPSILHRLFRAVVYTINPPRKGGHLLGSCIRYSNDDYDHSEPFSSRLSAPDLLRNVLNGHTATIPHHSWERDE